MDRNSEYDFAAAFAQITGALEDAAGFASQGQAAGLSKPQRGALVACIELSIADADKQLMELLKALWE